MYQEIIDHIMQMPDLRPEGVIYKWVNAHDLVVWLQQKGKE